MSRKITVGGLKKLLATVDDATLVVIPAQDHEYREAFVAADATALYDAKTNKFTEDHGEEQTPGSEYGKRIPVVIIY